MTIEQRLKSVAWTEAEVGVVIAGAVIGGQFMDDRKLFKKKFAEHPEWFEADRHEAPFMIKWSGAIKAGGALFATTYVKNPWVKLFLMGVAFQGTLQQARILTWDKEKNHHRIDRVGAGNMKDLDAKLRAAAEQYRMKGPEYVNGPDYVSGIPPGERYESSVAFNPDVPLSERYQGSVAGVYDETDLRVGRFSLGSDDSVQAY